MSSQIKHGLLCLAVIALCECQLKAQIVSVQDGDWSSPATWNGGIVPVHDNSSEVIINHQVDVPSDYALSIDDVTINGSLTIEEGATVTIMNGEQPGDIQVASGNLMVYGTLICSYDAALTGTLATNTTFYDGSYYQHNTYTEGIIPLANWEQNSTFELIGLQQDTPTMLSANWGQSFGNFIYNCPEQDTFVDFNARLRTIKGDFRVLNTNGRIFRLARGHDIVLTIGGDFVIEGNSEVWFGETLNSSAEVAIQGDFIFSSVAGGSSYLAQDGVSNFRINGDMLIESSAKLKLSTASDGETTITLNGDLTLNSGTIDALGAGRGSIIFNGTDVQEFVRLPTANMDGNLNFVVEENSTLDLNHHLLSNTLSGDLTVEGTLQVGSIHPGGVLQAGTAGNVNILGNVNFLPGSELEFNGATGAQSINAMTLEEATLRINNSQGVTLNGNIDFHDLVVENGNVDTGNFSCNIIHDVILHNGDFSGNGALVLNGSTNQFIDGNGNAIHNLLIQNNGSSITFESPLRLTNLLQVLSSDTDVYSNGNLTLVSSSEGTASLGTLAEGSSIIGDVTVQRFMHGIGRKYRYISSPVQNATIASLMDDFPITGTFEDSSTGNGINSKSPSMFFYNEQYGGLSEGWQAYPITGTSATNPLTPGLGYSAFIREAVNPTTWDVTGILNQGDFSFPITYTSTGDEIADGWNLIGNPYPSAIRWDDEVGWESNGRVSSGIAVRDNAMNGFRYWDGGVGELPDGVIASGQSFWIRTTGDDPQLTILETAKVSHGSVFYRKRERLDYVELQVQSNEQSDKTFLRLRSGAGSDFDHFDTPKLLNDFLSLSFVTLDGVDVAIDAIGEMSCSLEIPIKILSAEPDDEMIFTVHGYGLLEGSDFHLHNKLTGEKVKINGDGIAIAFPSDATSVNHLSLIITSNMPQETKVEIPSIFCASEDSLAIQLQPQPGISYSLIRDHEEIEAVVERGDNLLKIAGTDLTDGENIFQLIARSACSTRVMDKLYRVEKIPTKVPQVKGSQVCHSGAATLTANGDASIESYHWFEDVVIEMPFHIGSEFETPILFKSRTYYLSVIDSNECESERIPVVAEVIPYDSVKITLQNGELVSSYAEGNQWYLDGVLLPGENGQSIVPDQPGTYQLEVTIGNCQTSDEYDFFVTDLPEEISADIRVHPNPFTDRVFIRFRSEISCELFDVLSSSGTSVNYLCSAGPDQREWEIDTVHWPSGLYVLCCRIGNDFSFIRIIKR